MGKTQEERGDDGELSTVKYGGEEWTEAASGEQQRRRSFCERRRHGVSETRVRKE